MTILGIPLQTWILVIGLLASPFFAVPYLYGKYQDGWGKAKTETNNELEKLVSALKERVELLEKSDQEKDRINIAQNHEMGKLMGSIAVLKEQLNQRDRVIVEALIWWFDKNPQKAMELGKDAVNSIKQAASKK